MPAKSIRELRTELEAKEKQLAGLRSKRDSLTRQLAALDRQIGSLSGGARRGRPKKARKGKPGRKPAKVKKTAKRAKAVKRGKPGGQRGKSLVASIRGVLAKAPNGLRVREIAKAVKAAGYVTRSKDFYAIVAKTVLQEDAFQRVSRGVYKLAG